MNIDEVQRRLSKLRVESSGKPDAWKLARPVWGWGRGETPRPTPRKFSPAFQAILKTEGVDAVLLPAKSPNLNAHIETALSE